MKTIKPYLEQNGFTIDERVWSYLREGDIVELYNYPANAQFFSNDEFRKLCSYTEEQCRQPFTKLFWRSDDILARIMERVTEVMEGDPVCQLWGIPNHELVESLHPRKRTFEMETGVISPIMKNGQKVGYLSSCRVVLIFEWKQDL